MINFLPADTKREVKKEYLKRLLAVVLIFLSASGLLAVLLLFSCFLLVNNQLSHYERQLELSKELLKISGKEEIESEIKGLNSKINLLEKYRGKINVSEIISRIIEERGDFIKINSFLYDKGSLTLNGYATTRKSLLNFINSLKGYEEFASVESPPANLLREKNVKFSIFIKLKEK